MQNQEDNFDALRRALKLKRHEQPPPGFYNSFSRQVISRIRENDVHDRRHVMDAAAWEAPWISRLMQYFQTRPAYAGVIGAAACVLLLGGVVYSERPSAPVVAEGLRLGDSQGIAGVSPLANSAESPATGSSISPVGALPEGTTLFDKMRPRQTVPVFSTTNLLNQK